jgi:hypothetical protein
MSTREIAASLKPLKFREQVGRDDITFVRPSAGEGLFDRVELLPLGRTGEMLAVSVALSTVQCTAVQFRGLSVRDGWPEVCSEPERGRVTFRAAAEVAAWSARLAELAPERFARLLREKGDGLLSTTKEARERVGVIASRIVGPELRDAIREPFRNLTEEETRTARALMRLPFVVGSEELRGVYGVAVAALVRAGDDDIARAVSGPVAINRITRLKAVPHELQWRIRILVDRILMWRDESSH